MCLEPAHDRLCLFVDYGWLVRRVIRPTSRDALPLLQGIFILVVYAEGTIKGRWWPQFLGGGHADQISKITSWLWFWLWRLSLLGGGTPAASGEEVSDG